MVASVDCGLLLPREEPLHVSGSKWSTASLMERQESHSYSSVGRSPRYLCHQRQAQLEQESPPPRLLPQMSPPPRLLPRMSPLPCPLPRESPPPLPLPRMTCTSLPELHVTKLYRPHQREGSAGMGKAVRLPELVVAKPRALPRATKPAAAPWWEWTQRPDLLQASQPLLRSDAPPPGARAGLQWGRAGDPVQAASLAVSSCEPVWGSRGGEDSGWCELTADCRPEGMLRFALKYNVHVPTLKNGSSSVEWNGSTVLPQIMYIHVVPVSRTWWN